jgi:hypothetical protein
MLAASAFVEAQRGLCVCPKCHKKVSAMTKCTVERGIWHANLFK